MDLQMATFIMHSSPFFTQLTLRTTVISMYVFTSIIENSVDPDQLTSQKQADLNLHCFQNRINPGLAS